MINNIMQTNLVRKLLDLKFRITEILALTNPKLEKKLISIRKKTIDKEILMADISKDDNVILIGCGPHPTTALIINQVTQAKVVAIDKNHNAIKFAKSHIKKNNLEDKIKIECADGSIYPLEYFDIIFIAANVWPVDSVLNHIFKRVKGDVRVICRDFNNSIKYMIMDGKLSEICYIEDSYDHEGYSGIFITNHKSLIIKKIKKKQE